MINPAFVESICKPNQTSLQQLCTMPLLSSAGKGKEDTQKIQFLQPPQVRILNKNHSMFQETAL